MISLLPVKVTSSLYVNNCLRKSSHEYVRYDAHGRYSLFVLKLALNPKQSTNQPDTIGERNRAAVTDDLLATTMSTQKGSPAACEGVLIDTQSHLSPF